MLVIYSPEHEKHHPPFEYVEGRLIPYTEIPARAQSIYDALADRPETEIIAPQDFPDSALTAVHTADYITFLQTIYDEWVEAGGPPESVMPSALPRQRYDRPSASPYARAGQYIFDLSAPITETTFKAAKVSAECALTAAKHLVSGRRRVAYALCRPPGHHAYADMGGGFCYLNNAAIAAQYLRSQGAERVAILDIDVHHGNGTQDIFYRRGDVLVISLHGDPAWEYPYFCGHADEIGAGEGTGYNLNIPLPKGTNDAAFLDALRGVCERITDYAPDYVIVSAGFDTFIDDGMSQFNITTEGYTAIAQLIRSMGLPALIVQEGGYNVAMLGENVAAFLKGWD